MSAEVVPYDPLAAWPEPDPRLLNRGLRPAPVFPLDALGPIAGYVRTLAAAKDGPPDYLALALLTGAAGVVGFSRAVRLRPNWIAPCILWGLLVGSSSAGKSQPLDVVRRAVRAVEAEEGADFPDLDREWQGQATLAAAAEDAWRAKIKAAVKDRRPAPPRPVEADVPEAPKRPRIVAGWASVEKLARMFAEHPRGLFLPLDEGAVWFGNFGKYGGDGDAAFYLSAFDGFAVTIDRVKEGGSVAPDHAFLSACVGIQPERLSELLFRSRGDDGFVARFLPAWPDPVPPVWDTPHADEGRVGIMYQRLRTLRPRTDDAGRSAPVVLDLSQPARSMFSEWWKDAKPKAQSASGLIASFLGKGLGVVGRLALVVELLGWAWGDGPEPETISPRSMAAAINLFESYFAPMALRVYGDASRPAAERAAVALLREAIGRGAKLINAREVRRNWGLPGLSTPADVEAALAVLEDGDCIRFVGKSTPEGGRKRADYAVNPRVFGDRA